MTGAWFGGGPRHGRGADLAPARAALDGAAQALLDLDTRQGYVDGALRTARQFADPVDTVVGRLESDWRPIADRCFAASALYLDATSQFPLTDATGRDSTSVDAEGARRAFVTAHRAMAEAAAAVDSFYQRHRTEIDSASRAAAAVPAQVDAARRAATTATDHAARLGEQDPALLDLRSVSSRIDALSAALATLSAAQQPREQQRAAAAVSEAAQALETAVADAPQLAGAVRRALPSVHTRLDALRTRTERLPESLSALWREFNQASSADLAQHGHRAEELITQAQQQLAQAEKASDAGDPETAQESVTAARELAHRVDALIDEVTDRLARLRAVRDDRSGVEGRARFSVRDAQRLVVDRGLTAEWGSVLDAQSARIDRAVEALHGAHPDFWALLRELDAVQQFVADIVDRVRAGARRAGR